MFKLLLTLFISLSFCPLSALLLKENFQSAEKGDWLVTLQCKNYTLLSIHDKTGNYLTVDEVTIPEHCYNAQSFREWMLQGAPGHTAWVRMTIDTSNGQIVTSTHSLSKADTFLPTLLNLHLDEISPKERRRVGGGSMPKLADKRPVWNPPLFFEGKRIEGVSFDAYRTLWPHDGSELSGQLIVAYVPNDKSGYPSYFPYWLEVGGVLGKAKIRIVDSGRQLKTEKR